MLIGSTRLPLQKKQRNKHRIIRNWLKNKESWHATAQMAIAAQKKAEEALESVKRNAIVSVVNENQIVPVGEPYTQEYLPIFININNDLLIPKEQAERQGDMGGEKGTQCGGPSFKSMNIANVLVPQEGMDEWSTLTGQ